MRLKWLDALVIFYGILLIAAGFYGFVKAGSFISLVSGGTAGILEIGLAALARSNPRVARIGSAVVALLILGRFLPTFLKSHTIISLAISLASIVVICCLFGGHFFAMSKRKSEVLS